MLGNSAGENFFHRDAVDELHHDVGFFVLLADVVDGHNPGMGEDAGRLGFPTEPQSQLVAGLAGLHRSHIDGLDSDCAADEWIPGGVDYSHRSSTDFSGNLVPAYVFHNLDIIACPC